MSDGDSCRLKYFEGEPEVLAEVRQMWDEIFDDPEEFADYYFTEICKQNKILLAYKGDVLAGMIHLNPYEMQVEGKKELCYYIVGVAVKPEYREQGINWILILQSWRTRMSCRMILPVRKDIIRRI